MRFGSQLSVDMAFQVQNHFGIVVIQTQSIESIFSSSELNRLVSEQLVFINEEV